MAELATIARPYADALFRACTEKSADLQAAVGWAEKLAAIAADPQLQQLANDPNVSQEQLFSVITGVAGSVLPDVASNFLRVIIQNDRLQALPEVAMQFRSLVNRASGSSDAVVHSAFPIDAASLAELAISLEKRFGRKLNLSVHLDSTLIGGIRIVVGDEVLDTSVKARLEQMKAALVA